VNIEEQYLYRGAKIIAGDEASVALLIPASGGGLRLPQAVGFKERYITFYAETPEDHCLVMELNAYSAKDAAEKGGVAGHTHGVRFGIMPQFPVLICIDTQWFDGHVLFPGHTPGQLKVVCRGGRMAPDSIQDLVLEVQPIFHDVTLRLSDITLTNERPASFPIPDGTLIDELGQYKKKDWPGKTKSIDELKIKLTKVLESPDAYGIKDWSRYGGWTQKKLMAGTGYFTKAKADGRWWLVDPEGYAFFSMGADCVNVSADCRIDGVEKLLDWLPSPHDPDYQNMYRTLQSAEDFRPRGLLFSFIAANLFRVFGKDWPETWRTLASRQLKSNGMNTIANWSDRSLFGSVNMPYVTTLDQFPQTKINIFRDFPDVLSDEYKHSAASGALFLAKRRDDPWMIGYFLRNEPAWAFVDDLVIADEVLYNPAPSACKEGLIQFLKEKYKTPKALSQAWNHAFASFEELRKPIGNASKLSAAALADQREFSRTLLHAYISIPSKACRELDPHHLNLGMRWAWISDPDLVTGWENFDVFSINCYFADPSPALDNVRNLGVDLPIMIGEFHFGALDLGLTATGLRGTPNQRERGKAYRYYCERVAAHPNGVGCHWFQFYDQFPLGRFDGENYNIGLFDVCSLPNADMMDAVRRSAETVYHVAGGATPPFATAPQFIPQIAF
ncbi:MAG: beta-galactosidase, partial [Treponema sp.]|nr:beta-galactosidase [Treponema sp.]